MTHPSSPDYVPVDPIQGVMPWLGGKRVLAKTLVPMIEAIPHICYAEPFVGAGGVFFRRRRRPKSEVINDKSRDMATLFRVLQRHAPALLDELQWCLTSRATHDRLRATDPETLTDIERAARCVCLQYCAYGGKLGGVFAGSPLGSARLKHSRIERLLRRIHARLEDVWIDCLDWVDFLTRWDRPGTLFYLDPPYYGCENDYGRGLFERTDFERLSESLKSLQGRFLLSLNDHPEVRRTFARFSIREIQTVYQISGSNHPTTELLISDGR